MFYENASPIAVNRAVISRRICNFNGKNINILGYFMKFYSLIMLVVCLPCYLQQKHNQSTNISHAGLILWKFKHFSGPRVKIGPYCPILHNSTNCDNFWTNRNFLIKFSGSIHCFMNDKVFKFQLNQRNSKFHPKCLDQPPKSATVPSPLSFISTGAFCGPFAFFMCLEN